LGKKSNFLKEKPERVNNLIGSSCYYSNVCIQILTSNASYLDAGPSPQFSSFYIQLYIYFFYIYKLFKISACGMLLVYNEYIWCHVSIIGI